MQQHSYCRQIDFEEFKICDETARRRGFKSKVSFHKKNEKFAVSHVDIYLITSNGKHRIAFKQKRRSFQKSIQTFIAVVKFHEAHFYALKLTTRRRACHVADQQPPPLRSCGMCT